MLVKAAERPPFEKELFSLLTICSLCNMFDNNLSHLLSSFRVQNFGFCLYQNLVII